MSVWPVAHRGVHPAGKGRVCHKYIDRICQLVGIKDLSADVLGRKNPLSIVHAFFQVPVISWLLIIFVYYVRYKYLSVRKYTSAPFS